MGNATTSMSDRGADLRCAAVMIALYAALPAAAQAQDAAKESKDQDRETLSTVIVTAERLGRSLMETSTSVVVLDAEALEKQPAVDGIMSLANRIPNVAGTGRSSYAPSIRGVDGTGPALGADAFFAGTRPRLNVQIDGRPASYNEIIFGDFGVWDVGQVEILRGPQSALQGRNSLAGTIAIKTADPTFDTQAKFRVFGGNMNTRQYSAAFSAPLVDDQVAFRVSADRRTSDSFVEYSPFPHVSDPGEFESINYRAKLLVEPKALEGFSALFTVNRTESTGPQSEAVREPYSRHINRFDSTSSVFEPRSTSGIADLKWDVSEQIGLRTLAAYTKIDIERKARPGNGNAIIDGHELVVEPSINFRTSGGRVKGLAGLYFFDAGQDEFIDLFGGGSFDDSTRTSAVFAEATIALSDSFDLTLGARYEQEKRRREGSIFLFVIDLDETYKTFLPKAVLSWHPNRDLTLGAVVSRGYNGGGAGFTYFPPFTAYTFGPEYVWNYEAFARASLADGKLMLVGNVFFSDYADMQLPYSLSSVASVVRNADKVETYGAELSATWRALPSLQLTAGLGLMKGTIKSFPNSGLEGNDLPRAPGVSANLGVRYEHPSGFALSIDGRHSGSYYSTIFNLPVAKVGSYWLSNAEVSYSFHHVKVFGYVNNLFDAGDPLLITPADVFGPGYAQIIRPRTYGVGVQVNL